jgi:hypothetical protein
MFTFCVWATTSVVTLALLLPETGSVTPPGAVIVAVFVTFPDAVPLKTAVIV